MGGNEARNAAQDGQEPLLGVPGCLCHRAQPHAIPPDHTMHESPSRQSYVRIWYLSQFPRPAVGTGSGLGAPGACGGEQVVAYELQQSRKERPTGEGSGRRCEARIPGPSVDGQPSTMMRYFELAQKRAVSEIFTACPESLPSWSGGVSRADVSWRDTMRYSLSDCGNGSSVRWRRSAWVNSLGSKFRAGTSVLPLFHRTNRKRAPPSS